MSTLNLLPRSSCKSSHCFHFIWYQPWHHGSQGWVIDWITYARCWNHYNQGWNLKKSHILKNLHNPNAMFHTYPPRFSLPSHTNMLPPELHTSINGKSNSPSPPEAKAAVVLVSHETNINELKGGLSRTCIRTCIYCESNTWWFKVTFLGCLSDPFKGLSDLQLGDEKVTLNHLVCIFSLVFFWQQGFSYTSNVV